MTDQFLYRLGDGGEQSLYIGISDDWTRRVREHWREKPWAGEILAVKVERHPSRPAVLAAERAAMHTEHPRYNIQHNLSSGEAEITLVRQWTAGDAIAVMVLVIAAGWVLYQVGTAGYHAYQGWRADHDEFRAWKASRVIEAEPEPETEPAPEPGAAPETGQQAVTVGRPQPVPPAPTTGWAAAAALMVAYVAHPPGERSGAALAAWLELKGDQ